mmetsp:Transcript_29866/g.67557  ORF Transcript_29866/g.67557 Transcript_29866/m.67557 type:complete len:276 (+) Transcript_29866:881-1708(+)
MPSESEGTRSRRFLELHAEARFVLLLQLEAPALHSIAKRTYVLGPSFRQPQLEAASRRSSSPEDPRVQCRPAQRRPVCILRLLPSSSWPSKHVVPSPAGLRKGRAGGIRAAGEKPVEEEEEGAALLAPPRAHEHLPLGPLPARQVQGSRPAVDGVDGVILPHRDEAEHGEERRDEDEETEAASDSEVNSMNGLSCEPHRLLPDNVSHANQLLHQNFVAVKPVDPHPIVLVRRQRLGVGLAQQVGRRRPSVPVCSRVSCLWLPRDLKLRAVLLFLC